MTFKMALIVITVLTVVIVPSSTLAKTTTYAPATYDLADSYVCDERYTNITTEHTMCKSVSENCTFLRHKGKVFREQLLRTHNNMRNSIWKYVGNEYCPTINVEPMQWNDELYEMAWIHSHQCIEEPDCDLCHQIGDFTVAQNFAVRTLSKRDLKHTGPVKRFQDVIKEWAAESQLYHLGAVNNFIIADGFPTNWMNIFRATTTYVGCASSTFRRKDEPEVVKEVYVCNYGPVDLTEVIFCEAANATETSFTKEETTEEDLETILAEDFEMTEEPHTSIATFLPIGEEMEEITLPERLFLKRRAQASKSRRSK